MGFNLGITRGIKFGAGGIEGEPYKIDGSIGTYESFSVLKEGNIADLLLSKCLVAVHQGLLLCEMPCLPVDKQKGFCAVAVIAMDYGWVKAGMIFPFLDNIDRFQGQKLGKLRARFVAAIEEAFLAERGFFELGSRSAQGPADSDSADVVPGSIHGQEGSSNGGNGTCKGCGRTISFTKNRKSESDQHLCIACSKLYKERCYCGVCKRVWYDTDRGSFTQCDGCEIWVHTECIKTYTEECQPNCYARIVTLHETN